MRETKFRVWDGKSTILPWDCIMQTAWNNRDFHLVYDIFSPRHDDWVVMQYTGLKDKNGIEIYEGDIVRDSHGVSVVEYLVSTFTGSKFVNHYKGNPRTGPNANGVWEMCYMDAADRSEVIGNIYENPELLKEIGEEA